MPSSNKAVFSGPTIEVVTPSRLHLGLIDLNAGIGRMDGGLGIALEYPRFRLVASRSRSIAAEGPGKGRVTSAVEKVLNHLGVRGGVRILVRESYPQHIGLGSGTQIALAAGCTAARLYGAELGPREVARLVGRGGTSGIGVAAFENGGFILDGGHSLKVKADFLPSSASRAPPPPVLARHDFPDWEIALLIPHKRAMYAGAREVDIFRKYCPIPLEEVRRLSHLILMKLLPALVERDINTFGEGLNNIQKLGFKKIELQLQHPRVRRLLSKAQECSYGAGMSSFGPVIYCLPKDKEMLVEKIPQKEADVVFTKARNAGAAVG
jgi:beta-ribofuranosylaminobenzene 5'-phosphate synthase